MLITVPPTYPPGCKIVVIGEAPGREEEQWSICRRCGNEQEGQGQCRSCHQALTEPIPQGWVGQAGRCLQRACKVAGLDWATIGRSNVAKRRPFADSNDFEAAFWETIEEPGYTKTGKLAKRGKKITRKTAELVEYESELAREFRQHNPNLVVAAGNHALEAITGLSGITNYRGSIVDSRREITRPDGITPFKVLAVEHPSYIIRGNLTNFWILAHDLQKAKREAEFPEIRRTAWASVPDPHHEIELVLNHLRYIKEHPQRLWTLDVETRAGTLACFGCAMRDDASELIAFCVPIQTTVGAYWSPEEECQIWEALHEAARANPFLCNQNVEYDIYYLLRYGVEPAGVYMDTMLAHSLLYPELPKGLDFLCSWYLDDVVYYKGEGRNWSAGDRDEDLWAYNCKDDAFTLRCVEQIDLELKKRGMWEMYHGW
jgi:uracil-DNA glycosylase